MNTSLATFMKIGITALVIGSLLFGVAYTLLNDEASEHRSFINDHINEEYQ